MSWQQDLTPLHHDSLNVNAYIPQPKDTINESYAEPTLFSTNDLQNILENCRNQYANETERLQRLFPEGFCKVSFDSIMCWPPTPANETASVQCFKEFNEIKYDDTKFITRDCLWNGTWVQADYQDCEITPAEVDLVYYFVGYIISLVALAIAIFVFTFFKELRCLRNTIHLHLMWSHFLTHFMWIFTLILLEYGANMSIICKFDITLLHYCYVTTFFWMFVEGLYLYILVVKTLSRDTFKLRVYVAIGWGIPLLIIVIWAVAKGFITDNKDIFSISCQWFEYHFIDWVFLTPAFIVLLLNLVFLFSIMCVLITKLRSANTVETKQYHKAAKALLVLIPLLGITYIITIYSPTPDKSSTLIFECVRAVLLSTQGFIVALFYCFLNSEVQNTLRHHFANWKANRALGSNYFKVNRRHRINHSRNTEWTLVQCEDLETRLAADTNGHVPKIENGTSV